MTIKNVPQVLLAILLSTAGCGLRHGRDIPLIRARIGQCESLAFVGHKSFVVQVEPYGDASPSWTPNVAVLTAVSGAIEGMRLCPEQTTVAVDLPNFEMYVVQVVGVHGDVADVVVFDSLLMSEDTPWLCHELAIDDGCGLVWDGTVDVTRECISGLRVNCEHESADTH